MDMYEIMENIKHEYSDMNDSEIVQNVDKICRLCLRRKSEMLYIHNKTDLTADNDLVSIIFSCLSIEIVLGDGLPTHICNNCLTYLNNWCKFKEMCHHCNDRIKHLSSKVELIMAKPEFIDVTVTLPGKEDLNTSFNCKSPSPSSESDDSNASFVDTDNDGEVGDNDSVVETIAKAMVEDYESDASSLSQDDVDSVVNLMKHRSDVTDENGVLKSIEPRNHALPDQYLDKSQIEVPKHYYCMKCETTVSYISKFSIHPCYSKGQKRYTCNMCEKDYATLGASKTHLQIHKGRHSCPTCNKAFTSRYQVEVHARSHTGERPYICEHCGKDFMRDTGLQVHLKRHAGIKPPKPTKKPPPRNKSYVCDVCGKTLSAMGSFMYHMMNHNNLEKTHICDICGKGFNIQSKLVQHKAVHSTERPFPCEVCGKQFALRESLRKHSVMHTDNQKHKCAKCNKEFTWKKNLRTHKCIGRM